jgi:hypothetical protein
MKNVEFILAEEKNGFIYPKGNIMEGIHMGRNKILRNGKIVRIDLKLHNLGAPNRNVLKVIEYTR